MTTIGPLEELVLLAVQGLQPCYVSDVVTAINQAGYGFSDLNGSMYNILDRLEIKDCVATVMTPSRPKRGGRARKSYQLTDTGLEALERMERMRQVLRQAMRGDIVKYTCPACGYRTLDEPSGSHQICPVCRWQDDPVQLRFPGSSVGANKTSLYFAQYRLIQRPLGIEKDPAWRPLYKHEAIDALQSPDEYFVASCSTEPTYYWLTNEPQSAE